MHKKTEARVARSKPKAQSSFGQGPTHSTFVSPYLPQTSCPRGKVTTRLLALLVLLSHPHKHYLGLMLFFQPAMLPMGLRE